MRIRTRTVALLTWMAFLVGPAQAQDLGTVKNDDGSTSTTERDTRYGTYGIKTTTTDPQGRITKEEWKGNTKKNGKRDTLEETNTFYNPDGRKLIRKATYNPGVGDEMPVKATSQMTTRDALGGVTFESTTKYDAKGEVTEGTVIEIDPATGKKKTRRYNPSTRGWEEERPTRAEVEPTKEPESKKEGPKTEEHRKGEKTPDRVPLSRYVSPPVGVVIPSDARPGETVSGSVTTDPRAYDKVPALRVVSALLSLPRNDAGEPRLERVGVDIGNGAQPADGPVTVRVPENATRLTVRLVPPPDSAAAETRHEVSLSRDGAPRIASSGRPLEYQTPAVCSRGSVQAIWGPLGGDAAQTRVEVDGVPAWIVAETPRAVYWLLPDRVAAGPHRVVLREGGRSVGFEVLVMALEMAADRLDLLRGQSTRYHVRLRLGNVVPSTAWRSGLVPADLTDLVALKKEAPGLRLPRSGEPGKILFVLTNASPETIAVPDMPGNRRSFELGQEDFHDGVFAHDGDIRSVASGGFVIHGLAVAALDPVTGVPEPESQEISDTPEAHRIRIAYNRLQEARRNYHRTMEKTEGALEKGKTTAPKEAVDKFEDARRESHKFWHTLVDASAKYDANKTEENKKALDNAEKKMKDLDEAARDAKQKMIDSMSKEARKAYYDAEDAERQAGQELTEAQKEMDAAISK
jgi:hypothetical protein